MLRIESHLPITNHGGVHTYRLGERLNGIQEVSGSIPLISTKHKSLENTMFSRLFFFHKWHKTKGISRLRPNQLYPLAILILAKISVFSTCFYKTRPRFVYAIQPPTSALKQAVPPKIYIVSRIILPGSPFIYKIKVSKTPLQCLALVRVIPL